MLPALTPPPSDRSPGHDPNDVKLRQRILPIEAERLASGNLGGVRAVIVGFPCDIGVRRNNGRPGAALAPMAIRGRLAMLNAENAAPYRQLPDGVVGDVGDVDVHGEHLEEAHEALAVTVAAIRRAGAFPIVLGGGHETAFGHLAGQAAVCKRLAVVNLDPHLDVRQSQRSHSGTPFRQALERYAAIFEGRYACIGARPHANSPRYASWLKELGGRIEWADGVSSASLSTVWRDVLADYAAKADVVVTLDMDVVRASDAPGTSAASPLGITAEQFIDAARAAARLPKLVGLDLCEVSPPLDPSGATTLLAALTIRAFLMERFGVEV